MATATTNPGVTWGEKDSLLTTAMLENDFVPSSSQLESMYGQEHPDHTIDDWCTDVSQGDTKLGYWDWVLHQIKSHFGDPCDECGTKACDKVYFINVGFVCKNCAAANERDELEESDHFLHETVDPDTTGPIAQPLSV